MSGRKDANLLFFLALLGLGAYNVGTRWHCQRMKYGKKEESALENHVEEKATRTNFIWDAIDQDLKEGRYQQVHTRFPPEPNGYMHIGHCKALIMDFLTAEKYGGKCTWDELGLPVTETGLALPCGATGRWMGE